MKKLRLFYPTSHSLMERRNYHGSHTKDFRQHRPHDGRTCSGTAGFGRARDQALQPATLMKRQLSAGAAWQPASQQTGPQPPPPESTFRRWLNPARPEPVAGTRRRVRQPFAAEHALSCWPSPCPAGWHGHHGCNPSWAQISRTPGSAATRFWNSSRCFIWLRSTERPLAQRRMTYR